MASWDRIAQPCLLKIARYVFSESWLQLNRLHYPSLVWGTALYAVKALPFRPTPCRTCSLHVLNILGHFIWSRVSASHFLDIFHFVWRL